MVVIIAEKPSVAREIARIVGANRREDGYLSGNGYCVTWAFGHLVQISTPASEVPWRPENLPILPSGFYLEPGSVPGPDGRKVPDSGCVHQLEVIRQLFNSCEYIINAGDAGREGELIQRYIYAYVGCTRPVRRLWISSLTDNAIREGLANLHDSSEFDTLYAAGKARSEADWLVGINATRALSIVAGHGVRSLGRVQTPTLAMVCRRYLENRNFVPQAFWNIRISSEKDGIPFVAVTKDRFPDRLKAEKALEGVSSSGELSVVKVEKKARSVNPPYLHDLTSLQKEANRRYNLPAQTTLDIAQRLYEQKYLTYPRTGSRFVPEDVFATLPGLIARLENHPVFGNAARKLKGRKLNRRSVDATKVTDHHALLPTEVFPSALGDLEAKIYSLVVARLLESVSAKCEMISTTVDFGCAGVELSAKGNVMVKAGWKEVQGDAGSEEGEDGQTLPEFVEGDVTPVLDAELAEGKTKPKPLHTEASLLEAMEHAGKEVDDEDLKAVLKDVGIGTPATRAGEIETILKRGYVVREKKSLVPTEIGLAIYDAVKDKYIANVEMTGKWETSLAAIVDGKVSARAFDASIRRYVQALTSEILAIDAPTLRSAAMGDAGPDVFSCPRCSSGMKMFDNVLKCAGCGHTLWRSLCGVRLSEECLRELFDNGRTSLIRGFRTKSGREFAAALRLGPDGGIIMDVERAENAVSGGSGT